MAELESFKNKKTNIHIIANSSALDKKFAALSGGDRIYIELARAWAAQGCVLDIYVWEEGLEMCRDRYDLKGVSFHLWPAKIVLGMPFAIGYLYRIFSGLVNALKLKIPEGAFIYSASDFWQDSIPAMILKLRNKDVKWVAGFYMFAPKFWKRNSPYKGRRFLIGLFYWLSQLPVYYLIKRYADMVFVTSEPDAKRFLSRQRSADRIVVVRGGVDLRPSREYLNSAKVIPAAERKYDACFVGRFHPQKGVLELIDIWELVRRKNPNAKLVMIGIGALEREVKNKISRLQLNKNIDLAGFKDAEPKYELFKNSKIIVHPAIYDSGGMAAAEAMAWGLPGVSFDLEALKTYYPKGMIKVKCFDLPEFADSIIKLLKDQKLYAELSKEGLKMVREEWDWSKRSEIIYDRIRKGLMPA